jgi:hypothetical protein
VTRARCVLGRVLIEMANLSVQGRNSPEPVVRRECQRAQHGMRRRAEMEWRKLKSAMPGKEAE